MHIFDENDDIDDDEKDDEDDNKDNDYGDKTKMRHDKNKEIFYTKCLHLHLNLHFMP